MVVLLLVRLVMLFVVIFAIVYVLRMVVGIAKTIKAKNDSTLRQSTDIPTHQVVTDECPMCHYAITIEKEKFFCPSCGAKLVRTKEGKLLVIID